MTRCFRIICFYRDTLMHISQLGTDLSNVNICFYTFLFSDAIYTCCYVRFINQILIYESALKFKHYLFGLIFDNVSRINLQISTDLVV